MSSVVSSVPQPYTQAYSMTKAAVRALGASLRQELWRDGASGVRVCTVLPSAIFFNVLENSEIYTGHRVRAMPVVYPAERVARTIVNLIRAPRREVVVGPAGRSLAMQMKFTPGLIERQMALVVDKAHLDRITPTRAMRGNLHQPAPGTGSVSGGWHSKRRTAIRRAATAALLSGAAAAVYRWAR